MCTRSIVAIVSLKKRVVSISTRPLLSKRTNLVAEADTYVAFVTATTEPECKVTAFAMKALLARHINKSAV